MKSEPQIESILKRNLSAYPNDSFHSEAHDFVSRFKTSDNPDEDLSNASSLLAEIVSKSLESKYTYDDMLPIVREILGH